MLAVISILALVLVIIISCLNEKLNPGILAIIAAILIAIPFTDINIKQISNMLPSELFLMIVSITLLFSLAEENGTLQLITDRLLGFVSNSPQWYPPVFFLLTFILSALGPGNIAATALIAPVAMQLAVQKNINPFLMAISICTGANAGAFSPVAPTGVIAAGLLKQIGIENGSTGMIIFVAAAILQSLSAVLAFLLLKKKAENNSEIAIQTEQKIKINSTQIVTVITLGITILSILVFKLPMIFAAFLGSLILIMLGSGTDKSISKLPWDTILMVCGVSILISLVEDVGGLSLVVNSFSKLGLGSVIHSSLAFITGMVSAYSSSSGVVMPAFIPLVPGIIEQIRAGSTASLSIAIAVGSHMVDVSPLSSLGALTIAAYPIAKGRKVLFKNLMIWGFAMSVFAAGLAYLSLDLMRLWQ